MSSKRGTDQRPLVTFAVLAYQQETLIGQAVEAAFAQTYSPLEIILSDDASSDRTYALIEQMAAAYEGPHRVRINRNPENLGLIGHVNALFAMAEGEVVLLAAGDDVSLPERTERIFSAFAENDAVMLVHSPVERIDATGKGLGVWCPPMLGKPDDTLSLAASLGLHLGASAAYRRAVFERFGPILEPFAYEDLVLGFRARLLGEMVYLGVPLVRYRVDTGMTRKEKPLEKKIRKQRRVRALKMMHAVFSQRLADCRRIGLLAPAVQGALVSRLRDVESRLMYHEGGAVPPGKGRPASVFDMVRAFDEARREWAASMKIRLRGLVRRRGRS